MADGNVEEPPRLEPSTQVIPDRSLAGGASPPKDPGWYPVRTNPNEQTYWDGDNWTRRRRWAAGTGWAELGPGPLGAPAITGIAAPGARSSANPYAPQPAPGAPSSRLAPGVSFGVLLLILSAVAMMFGSIATWISSSSSGSTSLFGGFQAISATTSGVGPGMSGLIGINGYITLIAAAVVLVFAGLMAATDDFSVHLIGLVFSVVSLGLAIYAVVRLVQTINNLRPLHGVSVSIGWGVILVLGAAAVATLISLFEVTQNR